MCIPDAPRGLAEGLIVALAIGLLSGGIQAAGSTWSGTTGDGLWPTAGNWSAGVPGTTTSVTAGTNTDVVTFDIATNLAVNYGTSSRNIGGIQFGSGAGPFVVSRPGSNSTRLYFTLGGEVAVPSDVTSAQTLGRIVSPARLNNLGTLSVANSLSWSGAATADATTDWVFELGAANASDLLDITGGDFLRNTASGGTFRFDFNGAAEQGTFTLVQWSGTTDFVASDFSYTNLANGFTGLFSVGANSLTFSAVPEPSALITAVAAVGLAIIGRRRRSRGRSGMA